MELNCGGLMRPESRRYSSSVRIVLRERLAAAMSGIFRGLCCISLRIERIAGEIGGNCCG